MSSIAQLTRQIAGLAIPGINEPKTENFLQVKSLTAPKPEQKWDVQRLNAEARRRENQLAYAQIESLGFNLFTTAEIDALAVITVNNPGKEGAGSVRDLHLGPHNESQHCETCSGNFRSCYGHYGKIDLPMLMHPLAIAHIIHTLDCVCNSCGGLLVTEADLIREGINKLTGLRKLQAIKELVSRISKGCNRYANTPGIKPCSGGVPIYGSVKDIGKDKDYKLHYSYQKKGAQLFRTPQEIFSILDSISDSDAELLGFIYGSHPRSMIIERLLVIPYCARPDLYQDDVLYPDDISSIYSEIVRKSNDYFNPSIPSQKEDILKDLYFKVRHFMRNEGGQYKQGAVKIYTDITTRLQGKTALIRANIMGKRVNFAGRTVAAPGSFLRVDEIGIPEAMAVKLTRPIVVTELNRAEYQARYEARKVLYITPRSGKFSGNRIMITDLFIRENPKYLVQLGDICERILEDGDVVLVNRQPTLQRQSIIALKAKIIKGRVVMLNLSDTSPLNADFDGDELNIHIPQTIEAYAEAEQLLSVQAGLINEQNNQPMFGVVYNALTGAYLMTFDENTPENREEYRKALANFEDKVAELKKYQQSLIPTDLWNNFQALRASIVNRRVTVSENANIQEEYLTLAREEAQRDSLQAQIQKIINEKTDPTRLSEYDLAYSALKRAEHKIGLLDELVFNQSLIYLADRPQYDSLRERVEKQGMIWGTGKALASAAFPEDFYYNAKDVLIQNGVLIKGALSKNTIGRTDGSIIAEMYKQIDASAAVDFMSDIQFITREFLNFRGFTVGIDDCISDDPSFEEELEKIIADAEMKVIALTGPTSNRIQAEAQEREIVKALDIVKTVGDQIAVKKLRSDNNMLIMTLAGSKGTKLNLAQMSSLLGQQKVNNRRIPADMPGGRTLPVFRPGDPCPRARGFVRSSYYSGLMPDELFFHAMGGREGITDTAINTSNTGQLGHNLIKAAEDAHISGDGSVRSADASIIQFVYGGDGFNAGELGTVKIKGTSIPFYRNLNQLADKIAFKYA